jgi:hypothetical protein
MGSVICCRARNRSGGYCGRICAPGRTRCFLHGGLSTGPRSLAARLAAGERLKLYRVTGAARRRHSKRDKDQRSQRARRAQSPPGCGASGAETRTSASESTTRSRCCGPACVDRSGIGQALRRWPADFSNGSGADIPALTSALPPKADIGTGPRITFGAPAPAAWRYSPRSAAPHLW